MTTRNQKCSMLQRRALAATALFMLFACLCAAAAQAQAQPAPSTDRDNPTPLNSNVITGAGVNQKTEYFYSFAAMPGDVKIVLTVTADKQAAVSSVDISVFDADANTLMSAYANPDHGSSRHAMQTIAIKTPQTLLLQVTVSPGVNTFKISLSGSVNIQPAAATDASDSSAPAAATNDTSNGSSESNGGTVDQKIQDKLSKPGLQVIGGTTVNKKTLRTFEFSAGPGDVSLKRDVKSLRNAAVSSVDIELLNSKQSELAAGFANPSFGESKQTIIKAHLQQKQTLTLKVIISPGVSKYSLTVSGAVNNHLEEAGKFARLNQSDRADGKDVSDHARDASVFTSYKPQ